MTKFLDELAAIVLHLMAVASRMVVVFGEDYGMAGVVVVSVVGVFAIYWVLSQFLD